MESIDTTELLATAVEAARAAGELQKCSFGSTAPAVVNNTAHDLKIETDQASETIICDIIRRQYPQHAILSEEAGLIDGHGGFTWIIDPLDGTVNYYSNLPHFCTCIACCHTPLTMDGDRSSLISATGIWPLGEPLVGVVYAPYFDWMFSAAVGRTATCNGESVVTRAAGDLQDAVVGISYGSREEVIEQMEKVTSRLVRTVKKIRILGATGLDLVHVAKGSLSALVQLNVNIWDFAAASIILSESGIQFEARPNKVNGWQVLAAPPALFGTLQSIIDESIASDFFVDED